MAIDPEHYRLDEVARAETITGAEALAGTLGLPLETHNGRPAVRVDLDGATRRLAVPLPSNDLSAFDQISVLLATGPRNEVNPSLRIELASVTAGLPHPDSFRSGRAETIRSEAWREVLFPYDNFLIYGIPEAVKGVAVCELAVSGTAGPVWIAEVRAARRRRAKGPRLSDAGLLAALDLERPELAGVKAAAGNPDAALAELLKHLKSRAAPRHIYGIRPEKPAADFELADNLCANVVNGFHVGDPVNWRCNPNGYLEWMHAFNRTFFFMELLKAWQASGDERYVRKLDDYFASFLADNPEPVGHNGGGDPAWETLSTAVRIYGSWLECFFALLREPAFRDSTRIALVKSFHGHAEHLFHYKGYANNWLIVESRVLAVLGMLFPEFRRANAWRDEGLGRLAVEIEKQIYPDGADWELAPGYHMMAVAGFLDVYEIAQLNGVALPAAFKDRLPKTFEYIAGMTRPDGTLPSINDSGGYRARNGGGFLERGARLFKRPDLLASIEGPYAGRSRAFPDCGMHVLAGGTARAAKWLLFDAGPYGASHQHEDALSLELFAHGVPFLVDPGISGYMNDDWTDFYRRTRAHSTVLVNGAGQQRTKLDAEARAASVRGKTLCVLGPVFDLARGRYEDGYEGLAEKVVHERAVLFVREDYYVVFDEVRGEGVEHLEELFHFSPMRVEIEARRVRSMRLKGPNLEIVPLEPRSGLKVHLACGETEPVQGWVADTEDLPAPVAHFGVRGQSPLRFAAALFPYDSGVNAGVTVARVGKVPPGVLGVKLRFTGGRSDRIFWRHDPQARIPADHAPLDADVLVERLDARNRRTACAWVRGGEMTVEG
ncbi:MAG: heparinase II/III family protein [Planctomycetes bacterium]|nr:heparinase II/III family protein [Planctomycetota bacterium]